jgi:hypothetical protein
MKKAIWILPLMFMENARKIRLYHESVKCLRNILNYNSGSESDSPKEIFKTLTLCLNAKPILAPFRMEQ